MGNARIQLTDTAISAVSKMSEGNPGALSVCVRMLREGAQIDPCDFAGGLGNLLRKIIHLTKVPEGVSNAG